MDNWLKKKVIDEKLYTDILDDISIIIKLINNKISKKNSSSWPLK